MKFLFPILLPLTLTAATLAQNSTTPSTATGPAADLSTPRSSLLSLYAAMRTGDLPTVKACLLFDTPQESELFDLNFAQVAAPLKLKHAFEARFGPDAGKMFDIDSGEKSIDNSIEKIKSADIEISPAGDSAVLDEKKANTNPNAEGELTGVTLKLQDGKWRTVASTLSDSGGEVSPQQLELIRNMSHTISAACNHTLIRLAKGEFQTPDQAYAAYHAELQGVAKK